MLSVKEKQNIHTTTKKWFCGFYSPYCSIQRSIDKTILDTMTISTNTNKIPEVRQLIINTGKHYNKTKKHTINL